MVTSTSNIIMKYTPKPHVDQIICEETGEDFYEIIHDEEVLATFGFEEEARDFIDKMAKVTD